MPVKSSDQRLTVSVYLLLPQQVTAVQLALNAMGPAFELASIEGGAFISIANDPSPPKWVDQIQTLLREGTNLDLQSQSPGGFLWLPIGAKNFIITFGHAFSRIRSDWVVSDFGRVVALSVIPPKQVVEVKTEQVLAKWHLSSERAPRASAVSEFGFEPDRDMVAAVEGVPSEKYQPLLGTRVQGGTAFRLGLRVSVLRQTLESIADRFDSGDHKTAWPDANNLVIVRDPAKRARLDAALDAILSASRPQDRIVLAAPSTRAVDLPPASHYVVGRMRKPLATDPYLFFNSWSRYLNSKKCPPSVNAARDTSVHLLDANYDELGTFSMYECFGAEVSLSGQTHVLSSGCWYEATRQFVTETNAALAKLKSPVVSLAAWDSIEHEGAYNERACTVDPSIWYFDKNLVSFGGGHSRFEFCDLMHFPTKTLYFVKHPSGSAGVSHLCEQVRRTAENFFSPDDDFRVRLKGRIAATHSGWDVSWLDSRPMRHNWHLCLVLMGKQASDLAFFAKCGIARLVRELEQGAYNVLVHTV